jgi:hypothetical protein
MVHSFEKYCSNKKSKTIDIFLMIHIECVSNLFNLKEIFNILYNFKILTVKF